MICRLYLTVQRESIRARRSAREMASAMADSNAVLGLPSHAAMCRQNCSRN